MTNGLILVAGATGQQGGAVARSLLADGWRVRALVRDVNKPAAHALVEQGAELAQGDLEDRASLDRAVTGVYGVFSVQTPFAGQGVEGEMRQGKALADAALAAGVSHFVYSSVCGANRNTGIPHFESKWQNEQYVRQIGLPATILRPVYFMENFATFGRPQPQDGYEALMLALPPAKSLQLIATDDIGGFAAKVFATPQESLGKVYELAGDDLNGEQMAEVYRLVTGRNVQYVEMPIDMLRNFSEEGALMFTWFQAYGYDVDISALRAHYPPLKSFETWLRETNV